MLVAFNELSKKKQKLFSTHLNHLKKNCTYVAKDVGVSIIVTCNYYRFEPRGVST